MASIFSCMIAISLVHPQVDVEVNGADAAAVAPTLSSTQKAARHLSRKVLTLVSAACFWRSLERLSGPCEP